MSDHEVHVFPDAGIDEGMGKVPFWYLLTVAVLGVAYVIYLAKYMVDAQPSSAQMKPDVTPTPVVGSVTPEGDSTPADGE